MTDADGTQGAAAIALKAVLSVLMICGASLCSGLNLGMLALDKLKLNALLQSGTEQEKRYVRRVLPLLQDRHILIASILLGNCLCCEILPELLDDLIGKVLTIVFCVSIIVVFCEVIPQALMIKYQIMICGRLAWFVWFLIYSTFIIAFPLARLLDCVLGKEHEEHYSREELCELIAMHGQGEWRPKQHEPKIEATTNVDLFTKAHTIAQASNSRLAFQSVQKLQKKLQAKDSDENKLNYDEVSIIRGIFLIHNQQVKSVVKPLKDVFMLDYNQVLNREAYEQIYSLGYSRIPIYFKERKNMMGVLMTKQLIKYDPDTEMRVNQLEISPRFPLIPENHSLADALKEFKKGTAHIAGVVSEADFRMIGIVTMEDVLEQLLQEEIYDESDARRMTRHPGSRAQLYDRFPVK